LITHDQEAIRLVDVASDLVKQLEEEVDAKEKQLEQAQRARRLHIFLRGQSERFHAKRTGELERELK